VTRNRSGALGCTGVAFWSTSAPLRFLVTGYDVPCNADFADGAATPASVGYCVDINVDPKQDYSYKFATGKSATVDICAKNTGPAPLIFTQATDPYTGALQRQGKLGQRSRLSETAFKTLSYRPATAGILSPAGDCSPTKTGYFDPTRGLGRFAEGVLALLLPKPAFATHGGLGTMPGFADELSIFGPIDGYAFNGDLDGPGDIVGQYPDTTGNPQLRLGTWRFTGPNPSVVSVQRDDSPTDLYNKFVQINQAGGNSGRVVTFGAYLGDAPVAGPSVKDPTPTWRARWRAKVISTRAQGAAFVLRSGDAAATNEIARLTFTDSVRSQSGPITFASPAPVETKSGSWAQNVWQSFEVTLKWSSATEVTVTFGFFGDEKPLSYRLSRSNLQRLHWELEGRDGQTLGLDEVQLERVADGVP
jgi:hypothetical protein